MGLELGLDLVPGLLGGVAFDWHVDSVNGNDANSGKAPAQAFETLNALEAVLSADESVGLARGSYWEEDLTITDANVTLSTYGSGAKPIVDCSTLLASGSFDDNTDRADVYTNVYSQVGSTNSPGINTWINVWEDGVNLPIVADLATCDATPGSYIVSSHTSTTPTIYIHPTGSGDPASNGKAYRYAARDYGIYSRSVAGITMENIVTRRNLGNNGSTVVGRSSIITGCQFNDGGLHNVLCEDGSNFTDCDAIKAYHTSSHTYYVYNENTPAGLGVTFTNCTASHSVLDTTGNGFFGHINVSGNFGAVMLSGCSATNLNTLFSGGGGTSIAISNCTTTACANATNVLQAVAYTLSGNTFGVISTAVVTNVVGATINIDGDVYNADPTASGAIVIQSNDTTLTVENTDIKLLNSDNVDAAIFMTGATGVTLTVNNCRLYAQAEFIRFIGAPTYVGVGNTVWSTSGFGSFFARWNNVSKDSIAAWQAASGSDADIVNIDWTL